MTRDIDPVLLDEFKKDRMEFPCFLLEFEFKSGTLRLFTGIGVLNKIDILAETTANILFDDVYNTIERDEGDFIDDGFAVGQQIVTSSETNPGPFTIVNVSALALTVAETVAPEETDEVTVTARAVTEYTGAGSILAVSEIQESQTLEANGLTFTVSGVDPILIALADDAAEYSGQPCRILLGVHDDKKNLIGEPYEFFSGMMDFIDSDDDGDTATISLQAENRTIMLRRARIGRYTPEDQKTRWADDRGLDFIPAQQDKEILWGMKTPKS